jgi:hypothetical protein
MTTPPTPAPDLTTDLANVMRFVYFEHVGNTEAKAAMDRVLARFARWAALHADEALEQREQVTAEQARITAVIRQRVRQCADERVDGIPF